MPYGELRQHASAKERFGTRLKPLIAISHHLI